MTAPFSLTLSLARLRALRWLRQERSWWVGALKVLFGLYIAFLLVFFGLQARAAVFLYADQADPLGLIHAHVASAWGGLFVLRYLTQSGLAGSLPPYLMLPVDRGALLRRMMALDLVNLHTLMPMLFVGAFAVSSLAEPFGAGTAVAWGLVLALSLVCADLLCRWLRLRPWRYREVRWALIGVGSVVAIDLLTTQLLPRLIEIQLDATLFGSLAPLAGLATATVLLFLAVTRAQHDALLNPEAMRPRALSLGRFVAGRPVRSAVRLELLLIVRHRRTRQLMLMSVVFALLYPLLLGSEGSVTLNFFLGFIASGALAFNYGPMMFGWEGRAFDGLMVRPLSARHVVSAKLVLLVGCVMGTACVALSLFGLLRPQLMLPTLAAGLYVAGVGAPLTIAVALTNRIAVDLSGSMFFNYQGISGKQMLGGLLMGLPAFAAVFVWGTWGMWAAAGAGVVSLLLMPLWVHLLTLGFERVRRPMAASFRATV